MTDPNDRLSRYCAIDGGGGGGAFDCSLNDSEPMRVSETVVIDESVQQQQLDNRGDAAWLRSRCKQSDRPEGLQFARTSRSGATGKLQVRKLITTHVTTPIKPSTMSNFTTTTITITIILFVALVLPLGSFDYNRYYVNAKGLVGKLPGNPASCPEEPCTSDPQHVLRALKHTSYFVGVIFLMPILLYYMSKLFSKMRDCCAPVKANKAKYDVKNTTNSSIRKVSDPGVGNGERSRASPLSSETGGAINGIRANHQASDRHYAIASGLAGGLKSARTSSSAGTNNSNSIAATTNGNNAAGDHLIQSVQYGGLSKQQLDSLNSPFQNHSETGQVLADQERQHQHQHQQQKRRTSQRNSIMLAGNQQQQQQLRSSRLNSASSPKSPLQLDNHLAPGATSANELHDNNNLIKRQSGPSEQYNLQQHRYSMFIGSGQPSIVGGANRQAAGAHLQMTASSNSSHQQPTAASRRATNNHKVYPVDDQCGDHDDELADYGPPRRANHLHNDNSGSSIGSGSGRRRTKSSRSPTGNMHNKGAADLNVNDADDDGDADDGDADAATEDDDNGGGAGCGSDNGYRNGSKPMNQIAYSNISNSSSNNNNSHRRQVATRRSDEQHQQLQERRQQQQQFSFLSDLYQRQKHEQSLMATTSNNLEVPLLGPQHRHSIDGSILNNMLWSTLTPPDLMSLSPLMNRSDHDDDHDAHADDDNGLGPRATGRPKQRQRLFGQDNNSKRHSAAAPLTSTATSSSQKRREQLELFQAHQRQFAEFQQLQVSPFLHNDQSQLSGGGGKTRHSKRRQGQQHESNQQQQWDSSSSSPLPPPPSMLVVDQHRYSGSGPGATSPGAPSRDRQQMQYDNDRVGESHHQHQHQHHQYNESTGDTNRRQLLPADNEDYLLPAVVSNNNDNDLGQDQDNANNQQQDRRPSLNASAMRRTRYYKTGRI